MGAQFSFRHMCIYCVNLFYCFCIHNNVSDVIAMQNLIVYTPNTKCPSTTMIVLAQFFFSERNPSHNLLMVLWETATNFPNFIIPGGSANGASKILTVPKLSLTMRYG